MSILDSPCAILDENGFVIGIEDESSINGFALLEEEGLPLDYLPDNIETHNISDNYGFDLIFYKNVIPLQDTDYLRIQRMLDKGKSVYPDFKTLYLLQSMMKMGHALSISKNHGHFQYMTVSF